MVNRSCSLRTASSSASTVYLKERRWFRLRGRGGRFRPRFAGECLGLVTRTARMHCSGRELSSWYFSWSERVAKPLLQAKLDSAERTVFPRGPMVAYASNETGSMEIYGSAFPTATASGRCQAQEDRSRDGAGRQELFYLSAEGKMMAVKVKTGASFEADSPVALFSDPPTATGFRAGLLLLRCERRRAEILDCHESGRGQCRRRSRSF